MPERNTPLRALFIECGKHGGGSFKMQEQILANLDRNLISPFVLHTSKTHFLDSLAQLSIPTDVVFSPFHSVNSPPLLERLSWRLRKSWEISSSLGKFSTELACGPLIRAINQIIKKESIQVVHTINNPMMDFYITRIPAITSGQVAYISHLQGTSAEHPPPRLMSLHSNLTRNYIAISSFVKDFWVKAGIPEKKIIHIPNFITPNPVQSGSLKSDLNLQATDQIILCAGRFVDWKRFDLAIEAFLSISTRFPSSHLVIIGKGPEKASLRSQIQRSGCPRIHLLPWRKKPLPDIACATALVMPSDDEPFGILALEAMSLGVPVVASNSGGPSDFICHGQNGLIFAQGSADSLAKNIQTLLKDDDLKNRLIRGGKVSISSEYSASKQVPKIQNLLLDTTICDWN